jgi:hypothetical protein
MGASGQAEARHSLGYEVQYTAATKGKAPPCGDQDVVLVQAIDTSMIKEGLLRGEADHFDLNNEKAMLAGKIKRPGYHEAGGTIKGTDIHVTDLPGLNASGAYDIPVEVVAYQKKAGGVREPIGAVKFIFNSGTGDVRLLTPGGTTAGDTTTVPASNIISPLFDNAIRKWESRL